ncbi:MFS transporter [Actinomadura flavalba]|uniref:MFS transporter n=1 Tax=Actinomadura flavalba TaxID=1120938 RepID=UPI00035D798B|nr:MFS transporter [Actinomadura flavalba]
MATLTAVAPASARMTRRQKLLLVLLLSAQFLLAIDFSILNVALPVVGAGLGFAARDLAWIATAFALPAAGLTLLFGRIADLAGRRRMLLTGMALLAAGSVLGGLATSPAVLLTGRVLQGVATAIATPAALSLITTSFAEGPLRTRALGLSGALMSAGFTAGAILGGVLTDLLSWRWAFLVNVPVAVAVVVATPLLVTESRTSGVKLDVPGALTVTGGLLALVFGISAHAPLAVLAAVVLLAAFVAIERRHRAPLVPLRLLTRRNVAWGNIGGFIAFATMTSLVFLMTLYLQNVLGYSPLATGLALGVLGLGTVAGGLSAPRLIARFGVRRTLAGGLALQAVATLALLGLGTSRDGLLLLLAATAIGGFGNLAAIVAFMNAATSGLPDEDQGLATGTATLTQQIAITLGIPVMGAIAGDAALRGLHTATLANAAIVAGGAVAAAVFLRRAS